MQPGHVHPELADRRRPDGAGDRVQLRGNRIQRTGDPVIVEQVRLDAVRLLHRHRRRPLLHPHHRRGAVSRFATSASITSPWEIQATGRTGHSSSMISAIRSRRPNSATTGNAPSRFSSTRTTAISARARPRPRPVLDIPPIPGGNQ